MKDLAVRKLHVIAAMLGALATAAPASAEPRAATHPVAVEQNVYVPMTDGTRLATDIYRPADAKPGERFPCLFEITPYRKELRAREAADFFPARGYVYMEADARGTGGSEGQYDGVFLPQEQVDGYDAIEWLATKYPYCNGKVGMWGGSYSGINQYLIATSPKGTPPHLRTIAPQRALSDLYRDIVYHGGIFIGSFGALWSGATTAFNAVGADPRTSPDPQMAVHAIADHLNNDPMLLTYIDRPYDSPFYRASSAIDRIAQLDLPTFDLLGWYDAFLRGQLDAVAALLRLERAGAVHGPTYAAIGPWNHADTHFLDHEPYRTRILEWYDHWLAGGPTPAWFDEPRITYCEQLTGRNGDCTWQQTDVWPPAGTQYRRLFLHSGGSLTSTVESGSGPIGKWVYNPTAGQGEDGFSKWDNAAGGSPLGGPLAPQRDANQAREDEWKGLTFTTPVLNRPLTLNGPITLSLLADSRPLPGVQLPLARLARAIGHAGLAQMVPERFDTDFVVKLADVGPGGRSTLLTTGYLRASHRVLDPARTETEGGVVVRAVHFDDEAHLAPPDPGTTTRYEIEIWPTAKRFAAGDRLRIALYSADTANHLTLLEPVIDTVHAGSYVTLPVG